MEDFFSALGNLTAAPTPAQGAKILEDHERKVFGPPLHINVFIGERKTA